MSKCMNKKNAMHPLIYFNTCVPIKLTVLSILFLSFSCKNKQDSSKIEHAQREAHYDDNFMKHVIVDSLGVTGADGVISFSLSNGKSIFMMGDSFLMPVVDKKRDPDCKMINNTFIEVDKANNQTKSIYQGTLEDPETMLLPKNENDQGEYYWPGHGFEYKNELHIFMSKFIHKQGPFWNFEYTGTDYLVLEKDSYKVLYQEDFPYSRENGVHYGHALINEGEYTYIYGTKEADGTAALHVARAKMNAVTNRLNGVEYFNGEEWVGNAKETSALSGILKQTPEQFSVFKHKDSYVFVMQERALDTGDIYSYISDNPTGPWRNEQHLFHATEQENSADKLFTYNAMSHPQYIENDELLVSYCVNSFEVPKIHANTDYYRPRFIRVPMEIILE